jgi:photosystem II stability/assembly factor-like uncharacterized protein
MVPQRKAISGHHVADPNKDRTQWFLSRSIFPLRDAMPSALEDFWLHQENFVHVPDLHWENAGPSNFAGRVTCLLIDPNNQSHLYAGSAAGGLWRTVNGGRTWNSCWPKYLNQSIGALAIDADDSTRVLCATGEANYSSDCYPGSGVYVTSDSGFTWVPYLAAAGGDPLDAQARAQLPRRIGTIAFGRDENKNPRVVLGAVSYDESLPAALYLDRGANGIVPDTSWGIRSYNCHAVVFHPTEDNIMYVAIEPRGSQNGIWRSKDYGKTWERLRHGLPAGQLCGRMSVAISPSNPRVLYTMISSTSHGHGVLGVFRTHDGGDTWQSIGGHHFEKETQLAYNNCIAVHPTHPDFVVCGAVDLHLTTDGGKSWNRITTGQRGSPPEKFPPNFVHSDHHSVVIDRAGWIYSGNDGGVALSEDGGKTWQDRSGGMHTSMFYAADAAQSSSNIYGGGTQDHGTLIAGVPRAAGEPPPPEGEFTRVLSSDGGWIEFDPSEAEHVFGTTTDLSIWRHRPGQPWAAGPQLVNWHSVSIKSESMTGAEKELRGMAVLEIEPGRRPGRKKLWLGTSRVWQTETDGDSWKPISPTFDGSAISAIECATSNPQVLFVATSQGKIFRSTDGGETWSGNLANAAIPQRLITRIGTHPKSASYVVVTVAASGVPGTSLDGDAPYAHVFESDDMGVTWRPLDGLSDAGLPDVVYNALAFETREPYRLFVGGDSGVWMHDGMRWASVAGNMPNVVVSDLIFHHDDQYLYAATFGRGMWRLKVHEPFPYVPALDLSTTPDDPQAVGLMRVATAPAPQLATPEDSAQLSRTVTLTWMPVNEAIGYTVDVFIEGQWNSYSSERPALIFDAWSDGAGTWRVWALFHDSRRSPGSAIRHFTISS